MADIQLGDILAIRGKDPLSDLICRLTGPISHVGMFVGTHPPIVIEAIATGVKIRPLPVSLRETREAYCIQDRKLDDTQRQALVYRALEFFGEGYGYWDLLMQLANAFWHTKWFTERLSPGLSRAPICSALDALDYAEQLHVEFGCRPCDATPSDIWRFARGHPEMFDVLRVK